VEVDGDNERLGAKIRQAQLQKIPYMLIAGKRELEEGTVSVRSRDEGEIGSFPVSGLIERLRKEGSRPTEREDHGGGVWDSRCC
jgi:threonyl-tRNA synthetase